FVLVIIAVAGVAHEANGQTLYIIDAVQNVGERFDTKTGTNLGPFLTDYSFTVPNALAVGPDGTIYADDIVDQVVKFNGSTGVYEGPAFPSAITPQEIAVGPDGKLYGTDNYATGTGTPPNIVITDPYKGHVLTYDLATGDHTSDFRGPDGSTFV